MAESACSVPPRDPLKEDMQLLLECITCKPPCISSQKQALTLMADMYLMEDGNAREMFRTEGFLEAVIDLLKNTDSLEVKQACLCSLACATDNNVNTQIRLCKSDVFTLLYSLLRSGTLRLKSGTVVLLASIMNNNSQGQKMARETKLLYKLIDMFKSLIQEKDNLTADPILINYFQNIGNALSVACDNPQNELNQGHCISIFPVAVHVLGLAEEGSCDPEGELVIFKSVVNVFTSCIANNGDAQDKLYKVGGLRVMTRMLIKLKEKEKTRTGGEEREKREERLEFVSCLIQAILAAVTNNVTNTKFLVSFKIVSLLLELLSDNGGLNPRQQLIAITCLETLIENSDDHCSCFIECNGESLLINLMAESVDESIDKMIPIVIKMSRNRLKVPEVIEEDEEEGIFEAIDMPRQLNATHGSMTNNSAAAKNEGLLKEMSVIPFNTRINEWLEKAEAQLHKPPLYSPSIGPADTTNGNTAPFINTTLLAPPSVCTSFNASTVKSRLTDLEMCLAEEKERRRCLEIELEEIKRREVSNQEMQVERGGEGTTFKKPSFKPKRFRTKGGKNLMTRYEHKATPRPLTREGVQETKRKMYQSSKSIQLPNSGLHPYTTTPSERIIAHTTFPKRYTEQYPLSSHHQPIASPLTHPQPLVVPSTPKRQRPPSRIKLYKHHQKDEESHQPSSSLEHQKSRNEISMITNIEISDDSHLTGCIACMPSPAHTGDSLNSRNFIPSLSLSSTTCRYHRRITESVLTKKELHVVPELPKDAAILTKEPLMTSNTSKMENNDIIFSPLPSSPSLQFQYNTRDSPLSTVTTSTQCTTTTMSNKENEPELGMKNTRKNNRGLPLMTLPESTNGACRPLDDFIAKQVKGKATKEMARKVVYDVSIPHHNRNKTKSTKGREKSLFFTDEEVSFLLEGVARVGPRWKHILNAYPFQEGRTSTSLKDKYRLIKDKK